MATILEENEKLLRQSLDVIVSLDEIEATGTVSASNIKTAYQSKAKVREIDDYIRVMDLCNGGFLNDGKSMPIDANLPDGKYGYIASNVANSSGGYTNPPTITVTASEAIPFVTIEYADHDGNISSRIFQPTWSGSSTKSASISISEWIPNDRIYVVRVILGKSWRWGTEDVIKCSAVLRGVDTSLNPELQISEFTAVVYQPEDMSETVATLTNDARITYQSGYQGDMSLVRVFYLSSQLEYIDKKLTIKGQDATKFLGDDFGYQFIGRKEHYEGISKRLHYIFDPIGISFDVVGTPEDVPIPELEPIETIEDALKYRICATPYVSFRKNVAMAVMLCRNDDYYLEYVDAGRPTLSCEPNYKEWDLYDDQVGDFKKNVEYKVNRVECQIAKTILLDAMPQNIQSYSGMAIQKGDLFTTKIETVTTYADISLSTPTQHKAYAATRAMEMVGVDPWHGTETTNPWSVVIFLENVSERPGIEFVYWDESICTIRITSPIEPDYTHWFVVNCNATIQDTQEYVVELSGLGVGLVIDYLIPEFRYHTLASETEHNYSKEAIERVVNSHSNEFYTFTYRGNPHMQPRDVIHYHVGNEVIDMTIESLTLEHENGGLKSNVVARKGIL